MSNDNKTSISASSPTSPLGNQMNNEWAPLSGGADSARQQPVLQKSKAALLGDLKVSRNRVQRNREELQQMADLNLSEPSVSDPATDSTAVSLQQLLDHIENGASSSVPAVSSSTLTRRGSAASLQDLLHEVEQENRRTVTPPNESASASALHLSAAALQGLLDATPDPDSPSVVPPSGVYSQTPVPLVRTCISAASLNQLMNETRGLHEEEPTIRRKNSRQDLADALGDALDIL
jgi:hypothetical protein